MLRNIYVELLLVLTLTSAAVGRIVNPDMRDKEIKENPFMNEYISYTVIIYELLSIYFLLYSNIAYKRLYLLIYIVLISALSVYYLYSSPNIFDTIKTLFIYTPDIKSILIHIFILLVMVYIVIYK